VGFPTGYKKRFQHYVLVSRHEIKRYAYTVMTSRSMHSIAVHIGTDNTLTSTDDLTRSTNALD
jgi:hypothetical protein